MKRILGGSSAVLVVGLGAMFGCRDPVDVEDDPNPQPQRFAPGLHLVSVPAGGDTVDAVAVQALQVRVVGDDSLPVKGVSVQFGGLEGEVPHPDYPYSWPTLLVSPLDGSEFQAEHFDYTDSTGVAAARVKMGRVAGQGGIIVGVPTKGLLDTLRLDVAPGVAVGLLATPTDRAVQIGHGYRLSAYLHDRWWNAVPGDLTFESDSVAEVRNDSVFGVAPGRGELLVSAGSLNALVHVSVVPTGTLAAFRSRQHTGDTAGIAMFQLDGGDYRYLTHTVGGGFWDNFPDWSPSGDAVVYSGSGHDPFLFSVDLDGTVSQIPMTSALYGGHYAPDFSPGSGSTSAVPPTTRT